MVAQVGSARPMNRLLARRGSRFGGMSERLAFFNSIADVASWVLIFIPLASLPLYIIVRLFSVALQDALAAVGDSQVAAKQV